jgi:hypothetical protein
MCEKNSRVIKDIIKNKNIILYGEGDNIRISRIKLFLVIGMRRQSSVEVNQRNGLILKQKKR